jgi:hypothetical protein
MALLEQKEEIKTPANPQWRFAVKITRQSALEVVVKTAPNRTGGRGKNSRLSALDIAVKTNPHWRLQ